MQTLNFVSTLPLLMAGGGGEGGSGIWSVLIMMAIIFSIFYFLVIRPQKQQREEHQSMIDQLDDGDEVVTAGGIHGTVEDVADETLELRIGGETVITINKSGVSTLKGDADET